MRWFFTITNSLRNHHFYPFSWKLFYNKDITDSPLKKCGQNKFDLVSSSWRPFFSPFNGIILVFFRQVESSLWICIFSNHFFFAKKIVIKNSLKFAQTLHKFVWDTASCRSHLHGHDKDSHLVSGWVARPFWAA